MSKFLSTEWLEEMRVAARNWNDSDNAGLISGVRLCVQEVVKGEDGSEVRYYLAIEDGALDCEPGDAPTPDVTITQDYETAVALHRGEVSAQQAFIDGRLKVSGNVALVAQHAGTFATFSNAFAEMRSRTTF